MCVLCASYLCHVCVVLLLLCVLGVFVFALLCVRVSYCCCRLIDLFLLVWGVIVLPFVCAVLNGVCFHVVLRCWELFCSCALKFRCCVFLAFVVVACVCVFVVCVLALFCLALFCVVLGDVCL